MAFRLPGPHAPAWVFAETAASAGFSLISLLVIGRVIGPEAAGVGALAVSTFLLLDLAGACLFPDALVQQPDLNARHLRSALSIAVLLGLLCAVLLLGLAAPLARGTGTPGLTWLLVALAPLLPLSAFSGTASASPSAGSASACWRCASWSASRSRSRRACSPLPPGSAPGRW